MTALDVINEIKTLDPTERAEVIRFVHILEKYPDISDQNFEEAADQVMERHAVLLQKLAS